MSCQTCKQALLSKSLGIFLGLTIPKELSLNSLTTALTGRKKTSCLSSLCPIIPFEKVPELLFSRRWHIDTGIFSSSSWTKSDALDKDSVYPIFY